MDDFCAFHRIINTWIYDSELFYQWEKWTNQKHFYVKPDVIKEVKLFSQSEWIFGFLHCGTNFPPKNWSLIKHYVERQHGSSLSTDSTGAVPVFSSESENWHRWYRATTWSQQRDRRISGPRGPAVGDSRYLHQCREDLQLCHTQWCFQRNHSVDKGEYN